MTRVIEVPEAIAALEQVVEKFGPDTTYEDVVNRDGDSYALLRYAEGNQCVNSTKDGKTPLCIVGQVVSLLGYEIPASNVGSGSYTLLKEMEWDGIVTFTPLAHEALAAAQGAQDKGLPWGDALTAAKSALERKGVQITNLLRGGESYRDF